MVFRRFCGKRLSDHFAVMESINIRQVKDTSKYREHFLWQHFCTSITAKVSNFNFPTEIFILHSNSMGKSRGPQNGVGKSKCTKLRASDEKMKPLMRVTVCRATRASFKNFSPEVYPRGGTRLSA